MFSFVEICVNFFIKYFIFENKEYVFLMYILYVKKIVMFGNIMIVISILFFLRYSGLFDLLYVMNINIVDK